MATAATASPWLPPPAVHPYGPVRASTPAELGVPGHGAPDVPPKVSLGSPGSMAGSGPCIVRGSDMLVNKPRLPSRGLQKGQASMEMGGLARCRGGAQSRPPTFPSASSAGLDEDREGTGRRRHGRQPQLLPLPAYHLLQDGKVVPTTPSQPDPPQKPPASSSRQAYRSITPHGGRSQRPPACVKMFAQPHDVFTPSCRLLSQFNTWWEGEMGLQGAVANCTGGGKFCNFSAPSTSGSLGAGPGAAGTTGPQSRGSGCLPQPRAPASGP